MKIWIFLESLNPVRWGIRLGKVWHIVRKIKTEIPLTSKIGKNAPHCYLEGSGHVEFTRGMAIIRG